MFEHSNVGHKSEEVILSSSGSDNPGSSKESGILRSGNLIEPPIPPLLQSVKPLEVSRKQTQEVIAMLPPAPPITKIVTSLTDSIVDFCYEKPRSDTEIMNWFQMKGFEMPEIHKKLIQLTKNKKLHKYKQSNTVYFTYTGVRADTEMDIGV
jgi:predicted Fe-S protein YdhL (DUF1289 family)